MLLVRMNLEAHQNVTSVLHLVLSVLASVGVCTLGFGNIFVSSLQIELYAACERRWDTLFLNNANESAVLTAK